MKWRPADRAAAFGGVRIFFFVFFFFLTIFFSSYQCGRESRTNRVKKKTKKKRGIRLGKPAISKLGKTR